MPTVHRPCVKENSESRISPYRRSARKAPPPLPPATPQSHVEACAWKLATNAATPPPRTAVWLTKAPRTSEDAHATTFPSANAPLATPSKQAIDTHKLRTPCTPRKPALWSPDKSFISPLSMPLTAHRETSRRAAARRAKTAKREDQFSTAPPFAARELLSEMDAMAATHTTSSVMPNAHGSLLGLHPEATVREMHASGDTRPPWWSSATPLADASPPSRFFAQLNLCTAKMRRIASLVPPENCSGVMTHGSEELSALHTRLARIEVELQFATDAANDMHNGVWVVVLLDALCANLTGLASALAAACESVSALPEVCTLLHRCEQTSLQLHDVAGRAAAALHEAATTSHNTRKHMKVGLDALKLRLLRHTALVAATLGLRVAGHRDQIAAEVYAAASSTARQLVAWLQAASGRCEAKTAVAVAANVSPGDLNSTEMNSTLLVAVLSLLEIVFWLPAPTNTRVSLLRDAALLLLYRRANGGDDEDNEESCPLEGASWTDAEGQSCVFDEHVSPTTLSAFMDDLLRHICDASQPDASLKMSAMEALHALTAPRPAPVRTPFVVSPRHESRAVVTCAFVFANLRSETDLLRALEADEEERLHLHSLFFNVCAERE